MRIAIVLAGAAFLAACQSTSIQTHGRFNAGEAEFIKAEGKGVITGQAFLKRSTGRTVNAAGEIVRLTPATAYARERFVRLYGGRKFVAAFSIPKVEVDPLYASYTRTVKADHMGRFRFEKVAPGRYFVSSQMIWRERGEYLPSGGAMFDEVQVTGREERPVDVILSGN